MGDRPLTPEVPRDPAPGAPPSGPEEPVPQPPKPEIPPRGPDEPHLPSPDPPLPAPPVPGPTDPGFPHPITTLPVSLRVHESLVSAQMNVPMRLRVFQMGESRRPGDSSDGPALRGGPVLDRRV